MARIMDWIGQALSLLFHGTFICFMAIINCWQTVMKNIRRYVDYVDRTSPTGLTSWGKRRLGAC